MWNEPRRRIIDAILDEIIPPREDGSVLGAGALGVADFLPSADAYASDPFGTIDVILKAIDERWVDFDELPRSEKITILKAVEAELPQAFATLTRLTYMGYYSRADIRPHFGVGAHPIHPNGYDVTPENGPTLDALTAPVRARGQAYRNTPGTGGRS